MGKRQSRYEEVVVWVAPPGGRGAAQAPAPPVKAPDSDADGFWERLGLWFRTRVSESKLSEHRHFDAWVYTDIELPAHDTAESCDQENAPAFTTFKFWRRGRITLDQRKYNDYLRTFMSGESAAYKKLWSFPFRNESHAAAIKAARDSIFSVPDQSLSDLLNGKVALPERPVRIWWNCTPPELAELPWELLACELREKRQGLFSFVRGLPAAPLHKIPVKEKLRLAFIHDPERTPDALKAAVEGLDKSHIEVVGFTQPPREALKRVSEEGFELVHLVADGAVSFGGEGLLYFPKWDAARTAERLGPATRRLFRIALNYSTKLRYIVSDERLLKWNDSLSRRLDIEPCSAGEMCSILRGSRVTLLSLSTTKTDDDDIDRLDGPLLPSVYSAYAAIGSSTITLPNIIAPLGPCGGDLLGKFWRYFYEHLASPDGYSIEDGMAAGTTGAPTVLMSLFLRQRLGREFTARADTRTPATQDPTRVNARLEVARSLLEQLRAIDQSYKDIGSDVSDTPLVKDESARQTMIEQELGSLSELEEGE
ncbi:MAG TPA: hypothetical protein VF240_06540 [Pyrinomonadaceae bacterium]